MGLWYFDGRLIALYCLHRAIVSTRTLSAAHLPNRFALALTL